MSVYIQRKIIPNESERARLDGWIAAVDGPRKLARRAHVSKYHKRTELPSVVPLPVALASIPFIAGRAAVRLAGQEGRNCPVCRRRKDRISEPVSGPDVMLEAMDDILGGAYTQARKWAARLAEASSARLKDQGVTQETPLSTIAGVDPLSLAELAEAYVALGVWDAEPELISYLPEGGSRERVQQAASARDRAFRPPDVGPGWVSPRDAPSSDAEREWKAD